MLRALLLCAATATALSACASTTETASGGMPSHRDCFYANSVTGFNTVDDHHVRITVGPSRHYTLTTLLSARDLNFSENIALQSRTGFVCVGPNVPDIEIIGGRTPVRRLGVTEVTRDPETPAAAPQGS